METELKSFSSLLQELMKNENETFIKRNNIKKEKKKNEKKIWKKDGKKEKIKRKKNNEKIKKKEKEVKQLSFRDNFYFSNRLIHSSDAKRRGFATVIQ